MEIIKLFNKYGINIEENQNKAFSFYFNELIETNKMFNLTAITEEKDVMIKHFLDSVIIQDKLKDNDKVLDIGTGAGFPGVPLKIVKNDLNIVLLDSLQKRINFLNNLILNLKLKNIVAVHARAEDYIKETRESFDVVVSRAVAKLPTLVEYCLPFLKVGGRAFLYKSKGYEEELVEAKKAIEILGGKVKEVHSFYFEEADCEREIIEIVKIKNTPNKYPRNKSLPKLQPII